MNNHSNIFSALDIGSGNGRNSIYLAKNSIKTSVIDLSQEALDWVKQNAINNDVKIEINKGDVTKDILVERYDFDI
ncbi:class I SAM-dependent methyltransferase [Staphylococcus agnetis]|uniref:class I SAM-dependent methyltransferase n=1 Tax=Staphylococcus agnetis TaxID=985762 RepID=UPI0009DE6DB6|nr:methyltransferase domain-containing protein [Staphylococcus agnetis]NJH98545.1 methyltransferase domain-containing protein [Staphylococcus agnetis]PTH73435.1 methyltransferase domain-containing protein [Staphylococcus agnetis]